MIENGIASMQSCSAMKPVMNLILSLMTASLLSPR